MAAAERSGEEDDEAVRVRRMSSWHRSSVRHAASPNLQIDFGILELGSILRSFVLFDGIELVLGGLVGRTPRGSLSLNPIAYLVYSLHSTPFFCTRLRHRARVGQNSLLTIENHRYQAITDCRSETMTMEGLQKEGTLLF